MDKKIIRLLFIIGAIIFIVIIFAINISIERYTKESLSQREKRSFFKRRRRIPVEKWKGLQFPKEESEQEPPIPAEEPLLQ